MQRPRILPGVGQRSRATIDRKWEKHYLQQFWKQFVSNIATTGIVATRSTSYLLLFRGYPPVLEAICRQHRHCRICQQFQLKNEVTNLPQETGADHPKQKLKEDNNRDSDDRLRDLPESLEEFMVKRPPGSTGVGLLPRSNTRRTGTLGGASGHSRLPY